MNPADDFIPREDLEAFVIAAQGGNDAAMQRLVQTHERWIWSQSMKWRRVMDPDDAYQEGALGFMRAIHKWEPGGGANLMTYSALWIRSFVQRAEQGAATIRVWTKPRARKARTVIYELCRLHALSPHELLSDESLIAQVVDRVPETTPEEILALRPGFQEPADLQAEGIEGRHDADPSRPPFDVELNRAMHLQSQIDLVRRAIEELLEYGTLSRREAFILSQRYFGGEHVTLQDVAGGMSLSRERVRQLEARALDKLRSYLCEEDDDVPTPIRGPKVVQVDFTEDRGAPNHATVPVSVVQRGGC